jgi:hypothetical protein
MPPAEARDRMAADALAAGFEELLWVDPAVAFEPDDADRLRGRGLPVVGAVCPVPGRRAMACEFPPGTKNVRFGRSGGPIEVVSLALGFAVTRAATPATSTPGSTGSATWPTSGGSTRARGPRPIASSMATTASGT